jgi:hypothetical protein
MVDHFGRFGRKQKLLPQDGHNNTRQHLFLILCCPILQYKKKRPQHPDTAITLTPWTLTPWTLTPWTLTPWTLTPFFFTLTKGTLDPDTAFFFSKKEPTVKYFSHT